MVVGLNLVPVDPILRVGLHVSKSLTEQKVTADVRFDTVRATLSVDRVSSGLGRSLLSLSGTYVSVNRSTDHIDQNDES